MMIFIITAPMPSHAVRIDLAINVLAQMMADASRAGMKRIGFVSTPEPKQAK